MAFTQKIDSSSIKNGGQGAPETASQHLKMLNPANLPKQLSAETMQHLLVKINEGERNPARSILSLILNVNDVVAEYCLRHLEERMREEPLYAESIIAKLSDLPKANPKDQLQFLRFAFGVQGIVSAAILNHYRALGTES